MAKKKWLLMAIGTETLHVLFIIGILILGKLWMPAPLVNLAITIMIMGQIIFLWCPLSVFSHYCFSKYDPDFKFMPSLTFYLYRRFGRVIGIPIFTITIIISTFVGMARF